MKSILFIVSILMGLGLTPRAFSQEESFSLDEVEEPKTKVSSHLLRDASKIKIMGRVDLRFDKVDSQTEAVESKLENKHFFLFLKVKASPKVSFMGEFVGQSFFHVDYKLADQWNLLFGKIMVPFGDPRRYHSYYGGIQGGPTGIMLPNIWAESGLDLKWTPAWGQLDFYVVDGFSASTATTDVDLRGATSPDADGRPAVGFRVSNPMSSRFHVMLSTYYTDYWPGRPMYMGGLDLYSDYGLWGLKVFRFSIGVAQASFKESPTSLETDYSKLGDYYEFATNWFSPMEWRLRYGTYDHDDRVDSQEDSQSLALGMTMPIDVIQLLLEHQWNFEEVNEVDNDLTRLMVSLDF